MAAVNLDDIQALGRGSGTIVKRFPNPVGNNIRLMIEAWGFDNSIEDAINMAMLAIYSAIPNAPHTPQNAVLAANARIYQGRNLANTGFEDLDEAGVRAAADIRCPKKMLQLTFMDAVTSAGGWIIDLVWAEQVKPLSVDNIQNYFLSKGEIKVKGKSILSTISIMASALPRFSAIGGAAHARAGLTLIARDDSRWIKYHTTYTSTPALVQKAIDIAGNPVVGFWSAATIAAVGNAIASPWDRALPDIIPRRAVACAHAVLTAYNCCPRKWYQGEDAVKQTATNLYNIWLKFFEKMNDLQSNNAGFNAAPNIAALAPMLPPACSNN